MSAPKELVRYGYLRVEYIEKLRAANIRAWYDKTYPPINGKQDVWVAPWLVEALKNYRTYSKNNGRAFAGLTEWEFIVSAIPEDTLQA